MKIKRESWKAMKKIPYKSTDLVCLCCGNVLTINRRLNRQKNVGHIKDMYCPFCDEEVKFFEVKDVSIFKLQCMSKDDLTDGEILVMDLLKEREERNGLSKNGVHKKVRTQK